MFFKYVLILLRYSFLIAFYFYHHYIDIIYNFESKKYLLLNIYSNSYSYLFTLTLIVIYCNTFLLFFHAQKICNISKYSNLNCFSFFFCLNRFLVSFITVYFFSFFSLKRFLISLIMFSSSGFRFSIIICYQDKNIFLEKLHSIILLKKAIKNIIFNIIFKYYLI